jgi:uncharacterized protein YndB with AHSA1/START domain
MKRLLVFSMCAIGLGAVADAEVKHAAVDGFVVEHQVTIAAPPKRVFEALSKPGAWWNDTHTWSGHASNLTLEPKAGGCFCETWSEGSVEHGRVIYVERDKRLRLNAPFGPLQDMALSTVLTFSLTAKEETTLLAVTYRASGDSGQKLDALAPAVDGVLGEQWARLKRYVETGHPIE